MNLPPAKVEERILGRREIASDGPDSTDSRGTGRRSDLYKATSECIEIEAPIRIENTKHFKFMTVMQNTQEKDGKIYIKEVHTAQSSVFRPDDELVGLDSELINEFTYENIQRLFSFDADATGRRVKIVTIKRTELLENGARKTEELDVEVVVVTDMLAMEGIEHTTFIARRPPRQQCQPPKHQRRNVQWVKPKSGGGEQVFLQTTSTGKYLTVRNGAIVGAFLDENNTDDFMFHLEPMKAAYSRRITRFTKVVICCKIRWNSYWITTSVGSDGALGMELSEGDTDDHSNVFKLRAKSNGQRGTGFECLLFKNVYLQYNPRDNEVDITPYIQRRNNGATFKSVPVSTLFHVERASGMSRVTNRNLLYSSNATSPRSSTPIGEFESEEKTTGCCFKSFSFFRKKKSLSDTSDSMGHITHS